MECQTIISPSGERLIVLSEAAYNKLVEAAEDAHDSRTVAVFRRELSTGEEELVPSTVVNRLLRGENRVKVWREHRHLTAKDLAEQANIGPAFLSQIETGKRAGTVATLVALAEALNVTADDLIDHRPLVARIIDLIDAQPGISRQALFEAESISARHFNKTLKWFLHDDPRRLIEERAGGLFLRDGTDG